MGTNDGALPPEIAELLGMGGGAPAPIRTAPAAPPAQVSRPSTAPARAAAGNDDDGLDDYLSFYEEQNKRSEPPPPAAPPPPPTAQAAIQAAPPAEGAPQRTQEEVSLDLRAYRFPGISSKHNYVTEYDFEPKGFIRRAVDGEPPALIGPIAKMKKLFDDAKDPQDKGLYRDKLAAAYWNFLGSVVLKIGQVLPLEKRLLIRFGLLDASYLNPNQIEMLKKVPMKKTGDVPIYYMDEWLRQVAEGHIKQSVVDETKKRKTPATVDQEKLERKQGARDAELANLRSKLDQMEIEEENLQGLVATLVQRDESPLYEGYKQPYSDPQKNCMSDIASSCRRLQQLNKDAEAQYRVLDRLEQEINALQGTVSALEEEKAIEIDTTMVTDEYNSLKQMVKMCVGRQGNHFPILYGRWFVDDPRVIALRENVVEEIKLIERLDPGLFVRRFKREEHRIHPYLILLPGYGERGICWEPYDKYNKASSRGRIAICIFTKNIRFSLLMALADLRWQVAKESAQHYWMEEGLTGKYYEYYTEKKLKGDIKMHFIQDYITWITMESQGMQKLDRDARPVFWRYTPFPQDLKDRLKNCGFFYQDLYKRDQNIARSDGY